MTQINRSTHCSYAFSTYDSRTQWTCCIAPPSPAPRIMSFADKNKSPDIIQLQNDLLSGVKNKLCNVCWEQEDAGITSARIHSLSEKTDDDLQKEIVNKKLKYLCIDSGNVCNLSCRMCSPISSTALLPEFKKRLNLQATFPTFQFYSKHTNGVTTTPVEYLLNEDYSQIIDIRILGGEPFLNLDHVAVLEKIVAQGYSKQCTVRYVSNGTLPIPDSILNLIDQYEQMIFTYSVDAVGPRANYIRTGTNWDTVVNNIARHKSAPNLQKYQFQITVGVLNILYLDELFEWISKHNKHYNICPISDPEHCSFDVLTDEEKVYVIDKLSKSKFDFSTLINYVSASKFDPVARAQLFVDFEWTKEYKGLDVNDYLPELMDLLNGKSHG